MSHRQLTQREGGGRCCSEHPAAGSLWFSSGELPCPLRGHVAPGWLPLHPLEGGASVWAAGPLASSELLSGSGLATDLSSLRRLCPRTWPPLHWGCSPERTQTRSPEQLFCHSEADSERAANLEESRAEGCRESEAEDCLLEVHAGPQCPSPPLGRGLSVCSSTLGGIFRGTQWRAHSTMESFRV